jgi:hypothetical protein
MVGSKVSAILHYVRETFIPSAAWLDAIVGFASGAAHGLRGEIATVTSLGKTVGLLSMPTARRKSGRYLWRRTMNLVHLDAIEFCPVVAWALLVAS